MSDGIFHRRRSRNFFEGHGLLVSLIFVHVKSKLLVALSGECVQ